MIELDVYDFDGTLIPYDSLNRFLRELLRVRPMSIGGILAMRVLRLMSATEMKRRVNSLVVQDEQLMHFARTFAEKVAADVVWPEKAPKDGQILIVSASPMCYMQYMVQILGCEVVGSGEQNGTFVNMYGEEKLRYLQAHYSAMGYHWRYAASDSASDMCWMEKFETFELIKR